MRSLFEGHEKLYDKIVDRVVQQVRHRHIHIHTRKYIYMYDKRVDRVVTQAFNHIDTNQSCMGKGNIDVVEITKWLGTVSK